MTCFDGGRGAWSAEEEDSGLDQCGPSALVDDDDDVANDRADECVLPR